MEKSKLLPKGGKSFALILLCMLLYIFFEEFVFRERMVVRYSKNHKYKKKGEKFEINSYCYSY